MKNVLEWLENKTEQEKKKIAFIDPKDEISFGELEQKAKCIGTYISYMCDVRSAVGFYMEKNIDAVCGMLGAVYGGCLYSFLDTRQPESRMHQIISVLQPALILTDEEHLEEAHKLFPEIRVEVIADILFEKKMDQERLDAIREQALDMDPLYVNFTSGSTGVPKGVTICHRNVIDFIEVFVKTTGIQQSDILGNQAPFDFDVSVKDIYSGLCTGASVAIIPREYFSNPTVLMDYLCAQRCTVLIWAVSAMCFVSIMNGLQYKIPVSVRLVMFSGEVMPIKQLNKWTKALPFTTFVNLYGPTEITCNCTYEILETREYELDEVLPIGKAFDNEKVFLLDANDALIQVPDQEGEICVSGTCVALGYYHDMKKTNEVFVQNPLNDKIYERIYRTGDLGKYTDDLKLIYTSRKDFQIKHLGHRIELGEIEAQVEQHTSITRAICIYDSNKKRILLFYVGNIEGKQLISELRDVLPGYMLPNKAFALDAFPMNKNGKVDRNALKELGGIKHA